MVGSLGSAVGKVAGTPDIYTPKDARHALSKIKDPRYTLGSEKVDPQDETDHARIWSLDPEVLDEVKSIVKNASHVHALPFVLGTYNMGSRTMRMNDLSLTDPYMAFLMASSGLEGFAMPFLRGFYYFGRRSIWRHESIHARHHHQMAHFLEKRDIKKRSIEGNQTSKMDDAMYTIHEAGIEEALTRWQALKEARGAKEKATAAAAVLFYMEYAPFTGARNFFIDTKEKTLDLINEGKIRVPLKVAIGAGAFIVPIWLDAQTHYAANVGELISNVTPLSNGQVETAVTRGTIYTGIAVVSSLFSTKEKGALPKEDEDGNRIPTREYKFPYVYSPVTSTIRTLGLMSYLSRVWDAIPNYRYIESPRQVEALKKEISERLAPKTSDREHDFTMQVVNDALKPAQTRRRSAFPQDVYVKGGFIPALYLNLRDLYPRTS
ncbi:MAG: hypothetical protein Q7S45_01435 [Candidatus Curtissbacteria bacterium]|nr:hypothetical protein [Candidatus Curtissbacteria bacterium]